MINNHERINIINESQDKNNQRPLTKTKTETSHENKRNILLLYKFINEESNK